jgi:uncharacterized protein with PQ loop repeat
MVYDIIGYVGGILLAIQLIPQILKVIISNSTKDLSIVFLSLNTIGLVCMGLFGLSQNNKPVYIPVAISLINTIILLLLKIYYDYVVKSSDNVGSLNV